MSRHAREARWNPAAVISNITAILLGVLLLATESWIVAAATDDVMFAMQIMAGAAAVALAAVAIATLIQRRGQS